MLKVGVLASGGGTNLQSIITACHNKKITAEVSLVLSDRKGAYALQRARTAGIPTHYVPPGPTAEQDMDQLLCDHDVELVVGAGYMQMLPSWIVQKWYGNLINIHPALLPSFKGTDGQGDALRYGVKISGCTTHFMDEKMDHGPIILQAAVKVMPSDDRETLAHRILEVEHQLLPRTIDLFAQQRLVLTGRTVTILPGDSWRDTYETIPGVLYSEGY